MLTIVGVEGEMTSNFLSLCFFFFLKKKSGMVNDLALRRTWWNKIYEWE